MTCREKRKEREKEFLILKTLRTLRFSRQIILSLSVCF